MYKTVISSPATWANSKVAEPGVKALFNAPVLCCPAAVGVVTAVINGAVEAAAVTAAAGSDNNCTVDGCVGCVADSYACGGYVTPGRLVNFSGVIADDASVEELLATVTGRP